MLNKIFETIQKHKMFNRNEKVVLGISGGPDSVCLFHVLLAMKESLNLNIYCCHIEHGFRGEASKKDAKFVKNLCEKYKIPFYVKTVNVPKLAKNWKMSPEEGARKVRYDFYNVVLNEINGQKIALGHNLDDHVETVLMSFIRGTGLKGLGGILPIRDNKYVRPLIEINKKEILDYLNQNDYVYCIDETNQEDEYHRNSIRLNLIPYIEEKYNPSVKSSINRLTEILREDEKYLESITNELWDNICYTDQNQVKYPIKDFITTSSSMKFRLIRKGVVEISGSLKDISFDNIKEVDDLAVKGKTGSSVELPGQIVAIKDYDSLIICKKSYLKRILKDDLEYEKKLKVPGEIYIKEINLKIIAQTYERTETSAKSSEFAKNKLDCSLDYHKLKGEYLIVRNRRKGDNFHPLGMKGRKKLKDFFIDEKISRTKRNETPIITDGSDIVWVAGYRMSEKYKIDKETKKVLKLKLSEI